MCVYVYIKLGKILFDKFLCHWSMKEGDSLSLKECQVTFLVHECLNKQPDFQMSNLPLNLVLE